jgi:hypothetical protein
MEKTHPPPPRLDYLPTYCDVIACYTAPLHRPASRTSRSQSGHTSGWGPPPARVPRSPFPPCVVPDPRTRSPAPPPALRKKTLAVARPRFPRSPPPRRPQPGAELAARSRGRIQRPISASLPPRTTTRAVSSLPPCPAAPRDLVPWARACMHAWRERRIDSGSDRPIFAMGAGNSPITRAGGERIIRGRAGPREARRGGGVDRGVDGGPSRPNEGLSTSRKTPPGGGGGGGGRRACGRAASGRSRRPGPTTTVRCGPCIEEGCVGPYHRVEDGMGGWVICYARFPKF